MGFDAGRGQNCSGPGGRHVAHTGEAWPQWAEMQRRAAWRVLGTMGCDGFLPTDRQAVESTEEIGEQEMANAKATGGRVATGTRNSADGAR